MGMAWLAATLVRIGERNIMMLATSRIVGCRYHMECVNVSQDDAEQDDFDYVCPLCAAV